VLAVPVKIFGLPTHVLLVHAVVVFVPLACLAVVLHAFWPLARSRLGIVTPLLALVSLVLTPVTTNAGDYLERHLQVGPAIQAKIEAHEALGRHLIWYVIALFVLALVVWMLGRYLDGAPILPGMAAPEPAARRAAPAWVLPTVGVVSLGVAVATVVQLYRIGDAGAHAVWDGVLH
jgi:hypothetical protein